MRAVFAATVFALAMVGTAFAQEHPFPTVYVYGEQDNDRLRECGVSHRSAIAQIQSTLRINRVPVSPDRDLVQMYANVNASAIDSSTCVYSIVLEFGSFGQTHLETGEIVLSPTRFCQKGSLLIWNRSTAQTQLNTTFAEYVNECLSEFQGLGRLRA